MRLLKIFALVLLATAIAIPMWMARSVQGQGGEEAPTVNIDQTITSENFDQLFNGFGQLGVPVGPDDAVADKSFNDNAAIFAAQEEVDEGLGPVYNARSCGECHDNTVLGGRSQIAELRAGRTVNGVFVPQDDNSLINQRAIDARLVERVADSSTSRGLRMTTNVIGNGFIECINSNDIIANRNAQPAAQRGTVISVAVLEGTGPTNRTGRFGWKAQHASLISFAADAYVNEMGITSVLQPTENTSNGNSVAAFDDVPDPEEAAAPGFPFGPDIHAFAGFMRQTRAIGRGPQNATTNAGSNRFNAIGCAVCHTRTFQTLPAGTVINRGTFTVPGVLGDEIIHPFSDFVGHNVGTGDGIAGPAGTENLFRTAPLWGLRAHTSMFMHDGLSFTLNDAIQRHAGQATTAKNNFNALTAAQRGEVIAFLNSL